MLSKHFPHFLPHLKRLGLGLGLTVAAVVILVLLRVIPHLGSILSLGVCCYVIGFFAEKFIATYKSGKQGRRMV